MGSSRPLVSVVIPTYNRARLVQEAVASVLAQSYRPLELIVVDDGSTDATGAALAGRPEVRVLSQPHTGMPGQARNAGARLARGEYLAFLDSDDLWQPPKLERQVAAATQAGAAIWHTRERWVRSGRVVSQRSQRHRRSGDLFTDSLRKCVIGPSTVLLQRAAFTRAGGFREDLEIAEDYELWLRLTARYPVGYLDQELVIKRAGHSDQLSERYGQIEIFRLRALRRPGRGRSLRRRVPAPRRLRGAGAQGADLRRRLPQARPAGRRPELRGPGAPLGGRPGRRSRASGGGWRLNAAATLPVAAAMAAVDGQALPRQLWVR